ncbi:GntR family transcriptional regulator [Salibacterium sp. K-3]
MIEVDRKNPLPLYVQLKQIILDKIELGDWQPGDLLPTELRLQKDYDLSRTTVRLALGELVNEGVLDRLQGKGTYVAEPKLEPIRPELTGFTQDMSDRNHTTSSKVLTFEEVEPPEKVLRKFQLTAGRTAVALHRLRAVDDVYIGYHEVYLNQRAVPDVYSKLRNYDFSSHSLYKALALEGVALGGAEETVEGMEAGEFHADLLQIPAGSLVLKLTRHTYLESGDLFEFAQMVYRADKYKYSIKLR